MMSLIYLPAFLLTVGLLVLVHEFGHYVIARMSGVRILRFAVGFGKPLYRWRDRRGTEFALCVLPLGGYVRMYDARDPSANALAQEIGVEPSSLAGESYDRLSVPWRIAIALGGPLANFILAIGLYWALFMAGVPVTTPIVSAPDEGTVAASSGLSPGMQIVAVDGSPVYSWNQVQLALARRMGDSGAIELQTVVPGTLQKNQHVLPIDAWHQGQADPELLDSLGLEPEVPSLYIGVLTPGGAAEAAGFKPGDRMLTFNGEVLNRWSQWRDLVRASPAKTAIMTVRRGDVVLSLPLTPTPMEEIAEDGSTIQIVGRAGVEWHRQLAHFGPLQSMFRAVQETAKMSALSLNMFGKIITGVVSPRNLSGPVMIAKVAGDSALAGWRYYLNILAYISIGLGVLNLLPIPILDGGHIVFALMETVTGRRFAEKAQVIGVQIGVVLLAGVMLLVFYNDIVRLI